MYALVVYGLFVYGLAIATGAIVYGFGCVDAKANWYWPGDTA